MYAEIVILAMLRQRPQHGYEIKKGIEQVLGGTVALNNTILYPTLKRFEEAGAGVWPGGKEKGKTKRPFFHLTRHGSGVVPTAPVVFLPAQTTPDDAVFVASR